MDIFTHKQPRNINRSAELTGNDRFVSVYLLTKAIINIHYYHQPLTTGYSDFLPKQKSSALMSKLQKKFRTPNQPQKQPKRAKKAQKDSKTRNQKIRKQKRLQNESYQSI